MGQNSLKMGLDKRNDKRKRSLSLNPALKFFVQIPQRVKAYLESTRKRSLKNQWRLKAESGRETGLNSSSEVNLERQLQLWKENPTWVDYSPEIKVSVPKGSLCNLNVKLKVGLPPDAIYNIVTDPENARVFKNIKEVISRHVLLDEGLRQIVEVEQAAIWRFLWWSGTIAVHVIVDQNRRDYSMKFKQGKSGIMKRFEGHWRLDPLFVDAEICSPFKPKTCTEYELCTRGKGRVGSIVNLDQLIEPSIVPPPPISWYFRAITAKTTEMMLNDLLQEAIRLRTNTDDSIHYPNGANFAETNKSEETEIIDIKDRWRQKRKNSQRHKPRN